MNSNPAFVILLLAPFLAAAALVVAPPPTPVFPPLAGWTREAPRVFSAENLYGHINGGAELFLELGFGRLELVRYQKEGRELTLELYRMASPESALAVYLHKRGKETPVPGVAARNAGDPYQVSALKGRVLLQVHNPQGGPEALPALVALVNAALAQIPDEKPADLLALLPGEGRVAGSELLHRGEVSLQSIVTFGDGDLLDLNRATWAASADFRDGQGNAHTLIVVDYPDEASSQAAFGHLSKGLDSSWRVTERTGADLRLCDHAGKPCRAAREGRRLTIRLGSEAGRP